MAVVTSAWFIIRTLWHATCCWIAYMMGQPRGSCIVRFADALARMNVFYVKALQIVASDTALLTDSDASHISRYANSVPVAASDLDETWRGTLKQVASENPDLAITTGDNARPVFAGTIAVVYEGDMRGNKVVIKVQRRGVGGELQKAFAEFAALLRLVGYVFSLQNLNLAAVLEDNEESLMAQIDFQREVESQNRISHNFRNVDYVWIPRVYRQFTDTNPRMIVMDYVGGATAANVADSERDEYAVLFARCVSKCVLFDRFYHADLHTGNVRFVERSGKKNVALLDFGLMGEMTMSEQDSMYRAHKCFIARDWEGVAKAAIEHFVEPRDVADSLSPASRRRLISAIAEVVATPASEDMSPRALLELSGTLRPFGLFLARSFSRMQLALCASSSVHAGLGMTLNFREAMEKAVARNTVWEF